MQNTLHEKAWKNHSRQGENFFLTPFQKTKDLKQQDRRKDGQTVGRTDGKAGQTV